MAGNETFGKPLRLSFYPPLEHSLRMLPYFNCWCLLKIFRKRCHAVILSVFACEGIASVTIDT